MASLYYQVLSAVKTAVEAVSIVSSRNIPVTILKEPAWVPLLGLMPQSVVAPRADLVEEYDPSQMAMGRRGGSGYVHMRLTVYVGLIVDFRPTDLDHLDMRLTFREQVRLKLWEPKVLSLAGIGEYDVDYDPNGEGGSPPPPNCDGSWQAFAFTLSTVRSS